MSSSPENKYNRQSEITTYSKFYRAFRGLQEGHYIAEKIEKEERQSVKRKCADTIY